MVPKDVCFCVTNMMFPLGHLYCTDFHFFAQVDTVTKLDLYKYCCLGRSVFAVVAVDVSALLTINRA